MNKNNDPINLKYTQFWSWFQENADDFFEAVNSKKNIEIVFFERLIPALANVKEGFYFLAGMHDSSTAELIITVDGAIQNIAFAEDLVNSAPDIKGWKFTALKPAMKPDTLHIKLGDIHFKQDNLWFYANETPGRPDAISITVVHEGQADETRDQVSAGVFLFLDNLLGEEDFINIIDEIEIREAAETGKDLIPISELKSFLKWRQKEFIEKYDAVWYNTQSDTHTVMEAEDESGQKFLAIMNLPLLEWNDKPSHPWIAVLTAEYTGDEKTGLPGDSAYDLLDKIEETMARQLQGSDGYLYIGRQIGGGMQEMYFACKDFRKPSKVFFRAQEMFSSDTPIRYSVYKDKYWQSLEHFITS